MRRRLLAGLISIQVIILPLLSVAANAADKTKDDDRLRNSGTVLSEILDVPDDVPQDLLDEKADCVVVFLRTEGRIYCRRKLWAGRHVLPPGRRFQRPVGRPIRQ